jgi:tetratricopeptide (TPR) repeat protein
MFTAPRRLTTGMLPGLLALIGLIALAACDPADPIEHVRQLHASGRYGQSIDPLRQLLLERPDDPEVLYLYGVALTANGEPALGLWAFEKAMLDPEWLVPAALQRATSALSIGSNDAAAAAATRVLEVEPDNLQALTLRARARIESRRDYEGALEDADRVLEEDPDSLDALTSKTAALLGLERADEAEVAIEQLEVRFREADLGPELTSRYCFARVKFAKERGDLELAEERLEKCIAELPSATIGVAESIEFYDELGLPERSIEVLRDALAETPEAIDFRVGLAQRLRQAGEEAEGEALLREATEMEAPGLALLGWVALAEYWIADGRQDEAVDALEHALTIGEDAELIFLYAETLVGAGRYEEANAAINRVTIPAYAFLLRARVLQEQDRPAEALEQLDAGLALWPNNAVARYYAARAAEDVGDFDRAIEEYKYSLRADPRAADTRWRLAKLYVAQGKLEPAFHAVTHAWNREPETDPGAKDLELMALGIVAEMGGRPGQVRGRLKSLESPPALRARAVAAAAEGLVRRRGLDEALEFVAAERIDLGHPLSYPVLAVLSEGLIASDRAIQALEGADGVVAAHPGFAPFHALRGDALVALGRQAEARQAHEEAIRLSPEAAPALVGLGRLARAEGDEQAALGFFRRAALADPEDAESRVVAAEILVAAGQPAEARDLLEQALALEPYDPAVLIPLARLELSEDPSRERGRSLARRAVWCNGGDPARSLVEGLDAEGPPTEAAANAASS